MNFKTLDNCTKFTVKKRTVGSFYKENKLKPCLFTPNCKSVVIEKSKKQKAKQELLANCDLHLRILII